jgi:hypothetical protein
VGIISIFTAMNTNRKKQINKTVGIFILALVATAQLYGQSYNRSALMNREWVNRIPGKTFHSTNVFTDKEWVARLFVPGYEEGMLQRLYYLSDKVADRSPDKFEHNLVGKETRGRYIVMLTTPKVGEAAVESYEIMELTATRLKTRHVRSGTVLEYTGSAKKIELQAVKSLWGYSLRIPEYADRRDLHVRVQVSSVATGGFQDISSPLQGAKVLVLPFVLPEHYRYYRFIIRFPNGEEITTNAVWAGI